MSTLLLRSFLIVSIVIFSLSSQSRSAENLTVTVRSAFYSMTVSVQQGQTETFIQRLESFAREYNFADRIIRTVPGSYQYQITLWREDMMLRGINIENETEYDVAFYKTPGYPEIPNEAAEIWIERFKEWITEGSGVTISNARWRE